MTTQQAEPGDHQLSFKFVLVGDSAVGKTAMCKMFCEKKFNENQPQTIGLEFGTRIVQVENVRVKLQIWDTAGQERFYSITRAYFRSSAAVFLVYDVTNRDSFSRLGQWVEDAMQLSPPTAIKVLVGNKTDLAQNRAVSTAEAQDFATQHGLKFFETSALSGDYIDDAFIKTAQDVYKQILAGTIELNNPSSGARSPVSGDKPLTIGPNTNQNEGCGC
ncbi:Ras family protein [Trichomonas vaginalis G3]|uniref:Ras family protein n=1 Tax=Trichomonas vaginalis (strain ATCC PRA-98 / G3) TaxID=412133 RepID=A2DBC9_TRIV3|nr:Golgi to endosome transport [Trichomonas vaginalis G3]EAY22132.1 Ras family protein [Trichomonas vaginalis G3]KAI5533431.1 Golgi to endosome transport [Trichomonas vaginalis G3]|eukprot:XP_001583118.1 Ras family protein [Trichomonas vaginalis G3]